jgi:hypothetical protein
LFGTRRRTIATRPLLIELAVERGGTLPLVRIITRQHVPERERYAFLAALIAPLKTCSWVVKVQALEGNTTGVREALALAEYMRAHPERTAADALDDCDPYDREWDGGAPDLLDPLTTIRHDLSDVEAAVAFRPEVASEPPFS